MLGPAAQGGDAAGQSRGPVEEREREGKKGVVIEPREEKR
jgi:hypothetical protein